MLSKVIEIHVPVAFKVNSMANSVSGKWPSQECRYNIIGIPSFSKGDQVPLHCAK